MDRVTNILLTAFIFILLVNSAIAQSIDFSRPLAGQLPHGVPFARNSSDCNDLQMRWTSIQRQISNAHQQCLDSNNLKKNATRGNECTYAACEHLHKLLYSRQLQEIQTAQLKQCRESVAAYEHATRRSSSKSVLERGQRSNRPTYSPQPWEKPWEHPQSAARPHLSDEEKADLKRTIEHWVNLPARRREEFRRITGISDEELEEAMNLANPIDGRHPVAIAISIVQLMDQWMKQTLATANRRERRRMCNIWFPRSINLPSYCR